MEPGYFYLIAIIVVLLVLLNRNGLKRWIAHKTGDFTVFRVFLSKGKSIILITYNPADRSNLASKLLDYRASGRTYNVAGSVVDFRVIQGKDWDGDVWGADWEPGDIEKAPGVRLLD